MMKKKFRTLMLLFISMYCLQASAASSLLGFKETDPCAAARDIVKQHSSISSRVIREVFLPLAAMLFGTTTKVAPRIQREFDLLKKKMGLTHEKLMYGKNLNWLSINALSCFGCVFLDEEQHKNIKFGKLRCILAHELVHELQELKYGYLKTIPICLFYKLVKKLVDKTEHLKYGYLFAKLFNKYLGTMTIGVNQYGRTTKMPRFVLDETRRHANMETEADTLGAEFANCRLCTLEFSSSTSRYLPTDDFFPIVEGQPCSNFCHHHSTIPSGDLKRDIPYYETFGRSPVSEYGRNPLMFFRDCYNPLQFENLNK